MPPKHEDLEDNDDEMLDILEDDWDKFDDDEAWDSLDKDDEDWDELDEESGDDELDDFPRRSRYDLDDEDDFN